MRYAAICLILCLFGFLDAPHMEHPYLVFYSGCFCGFIVGFIVGETH